MTKPVVLWMGGWVSSLDCWEPQLRALFPEFDHRFLDTHSVLDAEVPPFNAGTSGWSSEEPFVVAAWSLGSLRVHRWMADGAWPVDVPVLSLCPVFRFVQPGTPGTFGESILLRMEQKLGAERETVLRDFWRRMPKAADMPPEWEAAWLTGTRRYDDESVLRALRYLRVESADPATLASVPARWELIAGAQDRLVALGAWKDELPAQAKLTVHPGGHIPFWECPDLVGGALRRLSGIGTP
jgi:pimeloyl-ACP methyl ester carboxylesterase